MSHQPSVSCQKAFFGVTEGDKTIIYLFITRFICTQRSHQTEFNSSALQNLNHLLIQPNELFVVCSNENKNHKTVFFRTLGETVCLSVGRFRDQHALQSISSQISHYKSPGPHNITAKLSLCDLISTSSSYYSCHFPHYAHKSTFMV